MLQALGTGERAGIHVRGDPIGGGLAWIGEVTDPATGRVGYDAMGSLSARVPGKNDDFPADSGA